MNTTKAREVVETEQNCPCCNSVMVRAYTNIMYLDGMGKFRFEGFWKCQYCDDIGITVSAIGVEILDDGFGTFYSATCKVCGDDMMIVRPGDVRCVSGEH